MSRTTRRYFLGGLGGVAFVALAHPALTPVAAAATAPSPASRVLAVLDASRDASGRAHVHEVAFVRGRHVTGTLHLRDEEVVTLQRVFATRDVSVLQRDGLHVGGRKFVFIRESEGGEVIHAVRRGEFVTFRVTPEEILVATSVDGMAHNRAVEALYRVSRPMRRSA